MTIRKIVGGLLAAVCAGFLFTHQQPVIGAAKTVYHDAQKDMSSLTSLSSAAMSIGRRVKTTDLTETVRRAPRATTNNAPPLDPVTIDGVHLRYNPYRPSDGPYPILTAHDHVWIDVSLSQELVYLFNGNHLLYTMITSSGIGSQPDRSSPLGVFHIQSERGAWFYAPQYQMGGKYWVSWHEHGVFLFHSVPFSKNKRLLLHVAAKLGHPASEGCFHLTIPDAKWFYTNIPYHTTVVVEQEPVRLLDRTIATPSVDQESAIQESDESIARSYTGTGAAPA